jgi:hypothetical protein
MNFRDFLKKNFGCQIGAMKNARLLERTDSRQMVLVRMAQKRMEVLRKSAAVPINREISAWDKCMCRRFSERRTVSHRGIPRRLVNDSLSKALVSEKLEPRVRVRNEVMDIRSCKRLRAEQAPRKLVRSQFVTAMSSFEFEQSVLQSVIPAFGQTFVAYEETTLSEMC